MFHFKANLARSLILAIIAGSYLVSNSAAQLQPSWNPARPDPAYTLSRVAGGAVLTHNQSGDTWWLLIEREDKNKSKATWLPINRVEDYGDVAKWLLAQEKDSTRSLVDVELAFARTKLKEAKSEYGSRHPVIIELSNDVRSLEKVKRAIDKQRANRRSKNAAKEENDAD